MSQPQHPRCTCPVHDAGPSIWDDPETPDIGRFPTDRPPEPGEPDFIRRRDLGNPDSIRTVRIRCNTPAEDAT